MAKKATSKKNPGQKKAKVDLEPKGNGHASREDQIRLLAYRKWEAAGKPMGDGNWFWFEAEKELLLAGSHT